MLTIHFGTTGEIEYDGIIFHIQGPDYDVLHNHDFYEFTSIIEGEYQNTINGNKEVLKKFSAIFLSPDSTHRFKSITANSKHLNILIKKEKFDSICKSIFPSLINIIKTRSIINTNIDMQALNKIILYLDIIKIADQSSIPTLSSMIICLVIESLMSNLIFESMVPYPSTFANILKECNSAKNLHWKTTDVATFAHYSQTHVNRLFKKYLNISVKDYLTNIKMDAAKNMLITTNYAVSEISSLLGYSSLSYFNKIFTKTFNSTPYKYKLNHFKRRENV